MSLDEWPILEFPALKPSILSRFSTKAGESVCGTLIKEIVENVDRPQLSSKIRIENDQELEWIMQFVNHAFGLPFYDDTTYGTLSSAVRIYLAWMTALTTDPHKCCPGPLRAYPDRYFRKMIDAFRNIFIPKALSAPADVEAELCRQGNEIRTILTAIRHLTSTTQDDYKDEVWSRSLLFLMSVCDQLLSQTRTKDEIGCFMSADLSQALFDCWTKAALLEYIPSLSYWRTLSVLICKWIPHVPVIEWWARKLLSLTVIIVQDLYDWKHSDTHLAEAIRLQHDRKVVQNVWLNMFQLIGNPVHCYTNAEMLLSNLPLNASNLKHFSRRASLSFFISVLTFSKIIDIYYGDSTVSIDFHECEELQAQWCDALASINEEKVQSSSQRSSNLSSSAIAPLENMPVLPVASNNENKQTASQTAVNRRSLINIPVIQDSQQQHPSAGISHNNKGSSNNVVDNLPKGDTPTSTHVSADQLVWYILRTNQMKMIRRSETGPSSDVMLELFMEWLFDAALIPLIPLQGAKYGEDLHSQKSFGADGGNAITGVLHLPLVSQLHNGGSSASAHLHQHEQQSLPSPTISASSVPLPMYSRSGTQDEAGSIAASNVGGDVSTRRSLAAQSMASSSDIAPATPGHSNNPISVFDYPSVDGVVAGRAAALGSLCKIVCAKSTDERLTDEQLAHFYLVLHEALIERDRLILCSLLYYSIDLFKLNLRGVEILLPNYLAAIDIVLTESVRLRLHPSIHPAEMRNASLRALGAIISWPMVYGIGKVFGCEIVSDPSHSKGRLMKTASTCNLEDTLSFLDLRQRMLRILLYVLRNELDSANLHFALGLCHTFCLSNAHYDLLKCDSSLKISQLIDDSDDDNTGKTFAVSALRGLVSAICDNLSKQHWNHDLVTCLAALDCLNSLATLPHAMLFYKNELSTGSLIVTSLCRFVDSQLQKPPMLHSRDLHSSIVLAYFTLANWISCAPMLTEIESCFSTLAHIIEFGMTGGKGMNPSEYKPASQRVCDAADYLLNILFNLTSSAKQMSKVSHLRSDDEMHLIEKFGSNNISMSGFKYFLLNDTSLIAFHEAQHIYEVSKGLPTIFAVIRTPYQDVHTAYYQLRPKATLTDEVLANKENTTDNARSPGALSDATACSQPQIDKTKSNVSDGENLICDTSLSASEPIKQFTFPPGIHEVKCKLDAESRPLESTPEILSIQQKLVQIRTKLDHGSTGSDLRDERNVWTQPSMKSLMTQLVRPANAVSKCNSLRVFLYDMGLIGKRTFGRDLIAIDSSANDFIEKLHSSVDKTPLNLLETVHIFYVKSGQRKAEEILQNCENLEKTSAVFCGVLNRLGKGVDISVGFPHWTGSWKSAFTKKTCKSDAKQSHERYVLNGQRHILFHATNQVEIAFITPTLSSYRINAAVKVHSPKLTEAIRTDISLEMMNELLKECQKRTGMSAFLIKTEKNFEPTEGKQSLSKFVYDKDEEEGAEKTVKVIKERQQTRKNIGLLASISSFWYGLANNGNNSISSAIHHEKEISNAKNITETYAETPNHDKVVESSEELMRKMSEVQPKDTMMILRRSPMLNEKDDLTMQTLGRDRTFLQTTIEEIANLEREYRQNSATGTNLPFKQMETPHNENGLSSDYPLNTISQEVGQHSNNEMWSSKNNAKTFSKINDKTTNLCTPKVTSSFEVCDTAPAYTTTIITAGTNEKPSLLMAQPTSVVVKSARFSAKRRDAAVLNAVRIFKTRAQMRRSSLATFPSAEKWDKKNNCESMSEFFKEQSEFKNDSKVVAFSPLSSTVIEFPITNSQQPLSREVNEQEDEEEAIDDIFKNTELYEDNIERAKKFGNNRIRRRTTLAKIAISRNRSSSDFLDETPKKNMETPLNKFLNPATSLESVFHEQIQPQTKVKVLSKGRTSSTGSFISPNDAANNFTFNEKVAKESLNVTEHEKQIENSHQVPGDTVNKFNSSDFNHNNLSTSAATILFIKSFFRRKSQHLHSDFVKIAETEKEQKQQGNLKKLQIPNTEDIIDNETGPNDFSDSSLDVLAPMVSSVSYSAPPFGTSAVDCVNEHNANISTVTNFRISDVSYSDNPACFSSSTPWQSSGLPPIGGQKSSAWQYVSPNSDKYTNSRSNPTEKVAKRSLDTKIFIVWLERMEDIYSFPFDEFLSSMDENNGSNNNNNCGGGVLSARRSSNLNSQAQSQINSQSQNQMNVNKPADFMIIYLCEVEPRQTSGLIHVQTEGVWTKKYGQPLPLIDGMVVPTSVIPLLIQQTVCNVARRKMIEVENYQFNHIKHRQSILEVGRSFASNISYADFFERYVNNNNSNQNKCL